MVVRIATFLKRPDVDPQSREALLALKSRIFPGPPLAMKPDEVTVYDVEAVFGPHVPPLG